MASSLVALSLFLLIGGMTYGVLEAHGRRARLRGRLAQMLQPPPATQPMTEDLAEATAAPPWERRLGRTLRRSGLRLSPRLFLLLWVSGPLLLGLVGLLLTHLWLIAVLLTAIGAVVPWLMVRQGEEARRRRFDEQLPDTLALFVSALRSGYSLARAVQMVSEEMPAPVSEESAVALGELALGLPLSAALERMAARVGSADWSLVVTAITTQQQTGGNLAEILTRIAETIRERVRVQGEIGTLTAEGKLSGVILTLLPPTLALVLTLRDPHYFQPLLQAPVGHVLIGGAIAGQIVGAVIIRRMVLLDL